MKILIFGSSGQVGRELQRHLPDVGSVQAVGRDDVDFLHPEAIRTAIARFRPDCIVNAAAYTAVDKAEEDAETAFSINADAVAAIAREARMLGSCLIHYSTDYVFDGSKDGAYLETDTPGPINVYGASKLAGEQAIIESGCRHMIFRTSWVIGEHGRNFARTILRLAMERTSLKVVDDQIGVPTSAGLIARSTMASIGPLASGSLSDGIYHLTPHGQTSWHGVATQLVSQAGRAGAKICLSEGAIDPIPSSDYPTAAKRPLNSKLNSSKFEASLGIDLPDWQSDFELVANAIIKDFL